MKSKMLIILLLFCLKVIGQTSVPNTTTFSLQDVVNVVPGSNSLVSAFANATGTFDPAYVGDKSNLLNFRNYSNAVICGTVFVNFTVSISLGSPCDGGVYVINSQSTALQAIQYYNDGCIIASTGHVFYVVSFTVGAALYTFNDPCQVDTSQNFWCIMKNGSPYTYKVIQIVNGVIVQIINP
jgi:uncharacterized membrane protein